MLDMVFQPSVGEFPEEAVSDKGVENP